MKTNQSNRKTILFKIQANSKSLAFEKQKKKKKNTDLDFKVFFFLGISDFTFEIQSGRTKFITVPL